MSTDKNFDKIAKYLSDNMVSEEREDFFAWVEKEPANKKLLDDSMEIWETAEEPAVDFEIDIDKAWSNMDTTIGQNRHLEEANQTLEVVSYIRPLLRVAAAAILLLMAAVWYRDYQSVSASLEEAIVLTQPAEKTIVELPDGSKVWLNEESQLKYIKKFEDRVVHLVGEAFFEVAKKDGASFEIYAGNSKTTVLGTEFNLRAYPEEEFVEISVEEGKVLFEAEKHRENKAILTQHENAVYTKASEEVDKLTDNQPNAAAWKKRELDFGNAKMGPAITALERYFNIEIEVENESILNCSWVDTMSKVPNPDLDTIFQQIDYATNYSFKHKGGNKYLLSGGTGCK